MDKPEWMSLEDWEKELKWFKVMQQLHDMRLWYARDLSEGEKRRIYEKEGLEYNG